MSHVSAPRRTGRAGRAAPRVGLLGGLGRGCYTAPLAHLAGLDRRPGLHDHFVDEVRRGRR